MEIFYILTLYFVFINKCLGCTDGNRLIDKLYIGGLNKTSIYYNIQDEISVHDDLYCVLKCILNPKCDYSIFCPNPAKRCFLIEGFIRVQTIHSSNTEHFNCKTLTKKTCSNIDINSYLNNVCKCPPGFTGRSCKDNIPDHCESNSVWFKSLVMNKNDVVESGDIQQLHDAVTLGHSLKVMVRYENSSTVYNIETAGSQVVSVPEIWAFTVENLKINHINRSDTDIARHRMEIMSNRTFASHWFYTLDTKIETRTSETHFSMDWFMKDNTNSLPACLDTTNNIVLSGSVSICSDFIRNGSRIYISDSFTAEAVIKVSTLSNIRGSRPPQPAHAMSSSGNVFLKPSYILMYTDYTNATDIAFRWRVKIAEYVTGKSPRNSGKWYVDSCWHEAVSISSTGGILTGSLLYLIGSIMSGVPLRATFLNYTTPLNDIRIENDVVKATLIDYLDAANVSKGKMVRVHLSTDGNLASLTHVLESNTTYGTMFFPGETKWFVESRKTWNRILSFNSSRQVTFGIVKDLYNSAVNGSDFRLVIKNINSTIQAVPINIVQIFSPVFLVLETGIISSVKISQSETYSYQWSGFLSSNGVYETVKWTTGSNIIQGRTIENYEAVHVYCQP